MRKYLIRFIFYAGLILVWGIVVRLNIWPDYIFPSPLNVLKVFSGFLVEKSFWLNMAASLHRLLFGYGLSIALGMSVGLALYKFKILDETVGNLILGLQTLPSICWLPLAILWFGLSEGAIIFIVVMGAFFPIVISTEAGIKNIDPIYLKVGRNMGARSWALLGGVILPAILPSFITGLRHGWSFAWRSLMAGELIFVTLGLGHLLNMGRELNDVNQVVAVMVVIITISVIVEIAIFSKIIKSIRRKWGFAAS